MEALRETLVIAGQDVKNALRSVKAIVFLALYALGALGSGAVVVWWIGKANKFVDQQISSLPTHMSAAQIAEAKHKALLQIMGHFVSDPKQVAYYIAIPVIVLFFFWVTRTFLPFLIALMSYDQVNGEVYNRSIRFTLLRSRRGSVVVGKIISNMVILLGITVVTNLLLVGLSAWLIPDFKVSSALLPLLRFWALTLPYALCFVAFLSLLSSLIRSPFVTVIVGFFGVLLMWLLLGLCAVWDLAHPARWAIPFAYNDWLSSYLPSHQIAGAAVFLGFGLLFAALSYLTLRMKDV